MRTKQTVMEEIQKRADGLRAGTLLTNAAAISKAVQENPELYTEYCNAPAGDPQPAERPRETVAQFVHAQLNKRASDIQKARNLSTSEAFYEAVKENEGLVTASRRFAGMYVDEVVPPPVHKISVQKVIPAPVLVQKTATPVKQPVTVMKAKTFNEIFYGRA